MCALLLCCCIVQFTGSCVCLAESDSTDSETAAVNGEEASYQQLEIHWTF